MDKEQMLNALSEIFSTTKGESLYGIEVIDEEKKVVEYQVKRFVRENMTLDGLTDQIAQIDAVKVSLEDLKSSLTK